MIINLNGPVTLTLKPETVAVILDLVAKGMPYNVAKPIIEEEILPQLREENTGVGGGSL